MKFFASLTINRCHIVRLCSLWAQETGQPFPFSHVLVSPLVLRNGILPILHKHRARCTIMFDSGGFHIQQKVLRMHDASSRLADFYRTHNWADIYVLPDHPLTSTDSKQQISRKLRATTRAYTSFTSQLPSGFSSRLMPVVHGATTSQIEKSTAAALALRPRRLGFGSFGTSGARHAVNSLTGPSIFMLSAFSRLCRTHCVTSHVFGVGGPASMCVLRYVPVDSFDTAGWLRAAAYGHVYLPYLGTVNVTGKSASHRYMARREFRRVREYTEHNCRFCIDHAFLQESWEHRALHNLAVLFELNHRLSRMRATSTLKQLNRYNQRYAQYLTAVLSDNRRFAITQARTGT
jgi:queuine/archaeosine tRNA-ribosyltransferase